MDKNPTRRRMTENIEETTYEEKAKFAMLIMSGTFMFSRFTPFSRAPQKFCSW
jgi:hypothetical protein